MVLSRRDGTIVARHEVPGKRPSKEPSRRVRYDRAQLIAHLRPKAFSNIRIQDLNTFLCVENECSGMRVNGNSMTQTILRALRLPIGYWLSAKRCPGKKLYRRSETNINIFSSFHSNYRIGAHTCPNHTVPYGTALLGGAGPGTSCQATIAPSLRDIFQTGSS
jgi:hypothetical protein